MTSGELTEQGIAFEVVRALMQGKNSNDWPSISDTAIRRPALVSIEGLPGSGKSTLVTDLTERVRDAGLSAVAIEVPNPTNSVGRFLEILYEDPDRFERLEKEIGWINPYLVVADLRVSILDSTTDLVTISRGPVSTFLYHERQWQHAFGETSRLESLIASIPQPDLLIFLAIDPGQAHRRVLARPRPLRQTDAVANYEAWDKRYRNVINSEKGRWFADVKVIDAAQPREVVRDEATRRVMELF